MSSITIISLNPTDYTHIIEMSGNERPFSYIPDIFAHFYNPALVYAPKHISAVEVDGRLVAAVGAMLAESAPDLWQIGIIVAPPQRRQGIGALAYRHLLETLRPRGAKRLLTYLYASQRAGADFIAQRGFHEIGRSISYQLDIAAADTGAYGDPDALLASQGLRFATLDRFPRQGLAERLLPIWNRSRPDQPQYWPFVPYHAQRLEHEMLTPNEVALQHSFAIISATNQIVALALSALVDDKHLYTTYLGVDPDFRQRKLATLLKLKLIAHARLHGIAFLVAENDVRNPAMHTINQRLGYQRVLDTVVYQKILAE